MSSSFQDYWEGLKPQLDDAFKRQLSVFLGTLDLSGDATQLRVALEGGKKIRGSLLCMISDTLGGSLESAIPRAVAVELIQTATLIHDDFVDQDPVRRHMPAAWTLEGARRAVLLGDVIFARAIEMMNDLSRADGLVVSRAIAEISKGALQEPLSPVLVIREIESNGLNDKLYERIIHLKTGILFGAACQLGAIAAKANDALQERSNRYGSLIGEAYQIADDMKEVKQHLVSQSIHPAEMAVLAPAFLYFVKDIRSYVLAILEGKHSRLEGFVLEYFRVAVERMEKEIERRLKSARSEIEKGFPNNEYRELTRTAPWELIGMFNKN